MNSLRSLIAETRWMVEAEETRYPALLQTLVSLKTGDTVEITYDGKKTKRTVTMSAAEYKDQASGSSDPALAFHHKFKAKPSVMLGPSSANKAHLNKPGKGGGSLSDYGDAVMFQATMSTQVKPITGLRKL